MSCNKTIIVTGAGGYIGSGIVKKALQNGYKVIACTSDVNRLENTIGKHENLQIADNSSLISGAVMHEADVIVHCAFSRRYCTNADVASSLTFARDVYSRAVDEKVPFIINLSSQGVYGEMTGRRDESTPAAPTMPYTMAKYASEVILDATCRNTATRYTNLRLDSIAGNQKITHSFVEQAMEKGRINIVGGTQVFSFLDVEDAIDAVLAVLAADHTTLRTVYNIGWNERRYLITELAQTAAEVIGAHIGKKVDVVLEKRDIDLYTGMNTELITADTGWQPKIDLKGIFEKIYCEKIR